MPGAEPPPLVPIGPSSLSSQYFMQVRFSEQESACLRALLEGRAHATRDARPHVLKMKLPACTARCGSGPLLAWISCSRSRCAWRWHGALGCWLLRVHRRRRSPRQSAMKRRCVACDSCTLARRRPSHAHQTQDSIWQTGNVVPVWLRMLALTCARRSCSTPSRALTQRAWMRVDCVGQRFATSWGPTVSRKLWQNTLCACYICVMGLGGP